SLASGQARDPSAGVSARICLESGSGPTLRPVPLPRSSHGPLPHLEDLQAVEGARPASNDRGPLAPLVGWSTAPDEPLHPLSWWSAAVLRGRGSVLQPLLQRRDGG